MADVPQNPDGSFTLYSENGITVTLTFPASPEAGFKVVTKDVPSGLPSNYTWLFNFGVQNRAGHFMLSVSYALHGSPRPDNKNWFVHYGGQAHAMNGNHTTPGDPPVGYG